jgi:hypothetical protein
LALRDPNGELVTEQTKLEAMASTFYGDLFTAQPVLELDGILAHLPQRVTSAMNESRGNPYTGQEVERVLFMMGANKAPGPDGFTAGFYQTHWETVGPSVTNVVLNFLNGGQLPEAINQTTIVLIPKVKHPLDLKNLDRFCCAMLFIKYVLKCWQIDFALFWMRLFLQNRAPLFPVV